MNLNGIKRSCEGIARFGEDDGVFWDGKLGGDASAAARSLNVVFHTLASVACLR